MTEFLGFANFHWNRAHFYEGFSVRRVISLNCKDTNARTPLIL